MCCLCDGPSEGQHRQTSVLQFLQFHLLSRIDVNRIRFADLHVPWRLQMCALKQLSVLLLDDLNMLKLPRFNNCKTELSHVVSVLTSAFHLLLFTMFLLFCHHRIFACRFVLDLGLITGQEVHPKSSAPHSSPKISALPAGGKMKNLCGNGKPVRNYEKLRSLSFLVQHFPTIPTWNMQRQHWQQHSQVAVVASILQGEPGLVGHVAGLCKGCQHPRNETQRYKLPGNHHLHLGVAMVPIQELLDSSVKLNPFTEYIHRSLSSRTMPSSLHLQCPAYGSHQQKIGPSISTSPQKAKTWVHQFG